MDELYTLLSDLSEIESELAMLQGQRESKRARISELVDSLGGKVNIPDLARMEIRGPALISSYDRGALDELRQSLEQTGLGSIADEIGACVKTSARVGGLSITMERKTG